MITSSDYKPNFIIIGAMKCATSTLHGQISLHDSFFMTNPKEPCYYSDEATFAKGKEWYDALFKDALPGQLKGESSTDYTKLPHYSKTVQRIAEDCPDIKCIYIMRHPVERLVSHYIHEWTQGIISSDINRAVKDFPELIEYGLYSMQLAPYLETFGQSNVLPMFTERLHENPIDELQTVFDFLNVTEKPFWNTHIRSNVSAERLRVCTWRDLIVKNNILAFLRRTFVPKTIRNKIREIWTMKKRPSLSIDTLQKVTESFDHDLSRLGDKLGLNLSCANFKESVTSPAKISWTSCNSEQ